MEIKLPVFYQKHVVLTVFADNIEEAKQMFEDGLFIDSEDDILENFIEYDEEGIKLYNEYGSGIDDGTI